MSNMTFEKFLSENDIGKTGSHQAGMLVPKGKNSEFIDFLPYLDPDRPNPETLLTCYDEHEIKREFRYIYYNNRLHGTGTRNEYRITRMTHYLRSARVNDVISFTGEPKSGVYRISIQNAQPQIAKSLQVKLRGWTRKY